MTYCRNCGAEIDENAIFCPRCGARTNGDGPAINFNTFGGGYNTYGDYGFRPLDTAPSKWVAVISFKHMAIRLNENAEIVARVKEGLQKKGGYCPCRLQKTEDNKCMCKEFREQIADPDFEGYCHCLLYYKSKD